MAASLEMERMIARISWRTDAGIDGQLVTTSFKSSFVPTGSSPSRVACDSPRQSVSNRGFTQSHACDKTTGMKLESLHLGMPVRHSQYGLGNVKSISEQTAEILFNNGLKTITPEAVGLLPGEPKVAVTGLTAPLTQFVELLGQRWHDGKLLLQPADPAVQNKEVPLEVFFHKIIMIRNNLRVLRE